MRGNHDALNTTPTLFASTPDESHPGAGNSSAAPRRQGRPHAREGQQFAAAQMSEPRIAELRLTPKRLSPGQSFGRA